MITSTQVYKAKVPMMQTTTVTIISTGTSLPDESVAMHVIVVCVCV